MVEHPDPIVLAYGPDPRQFATLQVPTGATGSDPWPVAVLIHGGFWRNPYRLDLMEPMAADLVARGYAVWNLEYRSVGDEGGAYPGTLDDVAAGFEHLGSVAEGRGLDLGRVAVIGHSAGGHLGLWLAGRDGSAIDIAVAIGLAAVVDLYAAEAAGLGGDATVELLGGRPDEVPDRYAAAQPVLRPGRTVLVHGTADDRVPLVQSTAAATGGDGTPSGIEVIEIPGADHFDVIDPDSPAWAPVAEVLKTRLGR